jgi:hypothetical protein
MRVAIAAIVCVVLVLGVPRLWDPRTWILVQAVHALGPVSGWRCADSSTYVYDPDQERPDSTLLAEPPEASVLAQVPWLEIDHVEANLRGGETLVSTHGPDDSRVYVLEPGRLQSITANGTPICNAHLSDWQIVGEEELG